MSTEITLNDLNKLGISYSFYEGVPDRLSNWLKKINKGFGGFFSLVKKEIPNYIQSVINTISSISKQNKSLEYLLDDFIIHPTEDSRFQGIIFNSLDVKKERKETSYKVSFNYNGENNELDILETRTFPGSLGYLFGNKMKDAEYALNGRSLGHSISFDEDINVYIKEALDRGLFLPEAENYAKKHKEEIGNLLLKKIENDPFTKEYVVKRKKIGIESEKITLGSNNNEHTSSLHEEIMPFYEAPRIRAGNAVKLKSKATLETTIIGDIMALQDNHYGLFGQRDKFPNNLARHSYGDDPLAIMSSSQTPKINENYKLGKVDTSIIFRKDNIFSLWRGHQQLEDLVWDINKLSSDDVKVYASQIVENGNAEIQIDLRPNMAKYNDALSNEEDSKEYRTLVENLVKNIDDLLFGKGW